MKILKYFIIITMASFIAASCNKRNELTPDQNRTGNLKLKFDHIVGAKKLQLNTGEYRNEAGELFTVNMLNYFISNIKIGKADGTVYIVPQDESYFLVDASVAESQFINIKVPEGDYTTLTFVLGVDSIRSTMPIEHRTGILDPGGDHHSAGMYWSWNSGYIFFKMEGNSSSIDLVGDPTGQQRYRYHIGGFGGYDSPTINNIKVIEIDLSQAGTANVRDGMSSDVHLFVDLLRVFNGSTTVSLANNPTVMFGDFSVHIANNYQEMFVHDHTHNFEKVNESHHH